MLFSFIKSSFWEESVVVLDCDEADSLGVVVWLFVEHPVRIVPVNAVANNKVSSFLII